MWVWVWVCVCVWVWVTHCEVMHFRGRVAQAGWVTERVVRCLWVCGCGHTRASHPLAVR